MTTMNSTICNRPTIGEASSFLADYAGFLFGSGTTCVRLEKNVRRIAASLGLAVEMSILPQHINLTVRRRDSAEVVTSVAPIREVPCNFNAITRLSRLSWQLADREISFDKGVGQFYEICHERPLSPRLVLVLASAANASFCRLFGGDATAMTLVFAATFAGFFLKQTLAAKHVDARIITAVCAFVSTVIAAADGLFGLGSTPALAIGTSVLYLIPGIPLINSFSDMVDRHYICSFGRMMNVIVTLCSLSLGLCLGMWLMNVGMF